MSKWIEIVKDTLHYFSIITVAVIIVAASYITVFFGAQADIDVRLLWQILIVSLFCSFSHLWFCHNDKRELGKKEYLFRWFLCYIYVNVVVLGFGFGFRWFEPSNIFMVIGMLVGIIVAFAIIGGCIFILDLRTSNEINQKLQERNGTGEEECHHMEE